MDYKQGKSEGFDCCDCPSNLKVDSIHWFLSVCDLEILWMTSKYNRAHGWQQLGNKKFPDFSLTFPWISHIFQVQMGHSMVLGDTFCVCQTRPSNMFVQCHIHIFISFMPNKTICWMGSIFLWQKRGWFKCLDLHIAFLQYDYYQNPK